MAGGPPRLQVPVPGELTDRVDRDAASGRPINPRHGGRSSPDEPPPRRAVLLGGGCRHVRGALPDRRLNATAPAYPEPRAGGPRVSIPLARAATPRHQRERIALPHSSRRHGVERCVRGR